MRRFSANYIFPVVGRPLKNGVVEVDDNGLITRLLENGTDSTEFSNTQFFNGVIIPGFVNAHCHLELSHLQGHFCRGLGLTEFVAQMVRKRVESAETIEQSVEAALREARNQGIVAIGDICNTTDSLRAKQKSAINCINFVEFFDVNPKCAKQVFDKQMLVFQQFKAHFPSTYIAPHAPYSVSDALWQLLGSHLTACTSVHFAETPAEYDLIAHHQGTFYSRYTANYPDYVVPDASTPAGLLVDKINKNCNLLLVHCIYSAENELLTLLNRFANLTVVVCPESNLFIEGKMADLAMLQRLGARIAVGTDSLASVSSLSIFDNIMLILQHFPQIKFLDVLSWATLNGAKAFGINHLYGSIEIGKKPGLNLITNFDFVRMCPTRDSRIQCLLP